MANQGFGSLRHLAVRFAGSLRPGGPSAADTAWAAQFMVPGEQQLFARMSGPDRRHAVEVARAVPGLLATPEAQVPRPVMAAALLHDVGKNVSGLGTFSRVGATVVTLVAGRSRVAGWSERPGGVRSRLGAYARHDELGAAALDDAGADPLTSSWARDHHRPPEQWRVSAEVGAALKAADGD